MFNERDPKQKRVVPRANELNGKTWARYSISIWSDIHKTSEEIALDHPAVFPLALVRRLIECFTTGEDRVVLDPFAGVGSTVVAAHLSGKKGIGIEIEPRFVDKARRRLAQVGCDPDTLTPVTTVESEIICGDALEILGTMDNNSVDLVVTSPPYWDILSRKRTADRKPTQDYGPEERICRKFATTANS